MNTAPQSNLWREQGSPSWSFCSKDRNDYNPQPDQLTFDDAVDVWLRHWTGEYQHHVAACYRVNPGRVNDVLKGRKNPGSEQVAAPKRGCLKVGDTVKCFAASVRCL